MNDAGGGTEEDDVIGTIAEEKTACISWNTRVLAEMGLPLDAIKREDGLPIWARTLHHDTPMEMLTESFMSRVEAIENTKSIETQAERFHNFRLIPLALYPMIPQEVTATAEAYDQARKAYGQALQATDLSFLFGPLMPPHTWNGKTLAGVPHGN